MKPLIGLIETVLANPRIFEWQQKLCNNYSAVAQEFSQELSGLGKTVLDVGCSTGTCAGSIIDMKNNQFFGIDIVPKYVTTATQRYPQGHFRCMDARQMDFPDEFFDVVLFTGVLHHMDDQLIRDCLADIRRVLKPEGVVLIAEPVFTKRKLVSTFLLKLDRGRFIRTKSGYEKLFDGFQVVRKGNFGFSLHRFCSFVLRKQYLA